jgi:hypothetical protein
MKDATLKHIATEFRAGMLGNRPSNWTCGMVCFALQGLLAGIHSFNTQLFESDLGEMNHIWLKLPDGRALDPTIDQFNHFFPHKDYPKVYLGPLLDIHEGAKPFNTNSKGGSE